jgi:hypothetical protein
MKCLPFPKLDLNKFFNPLGPIEEKYRKIRKQDLQAYQQLCRTYKIDPADFSARYQLASLMVSKPMTTEEISIIIKGTAALMSRL